MQSKSARFTVLAMAVLAAALATIVLWGINPVSIVWLLVAGWTALVTRWFGTASPVPAAGPLALGGVILTALCLPDTAIAAAASALPAALRDPMVWTFWLIIAGALAAATLLLVAAWGTVQHTPTRHTRLVYGLTLALTVCLAVQVLSHVYWFMVWDTTSDPLGSYWLILLIPPMVVAAGVLLLHLPRGHKAAGPAYVLGVLLVVGVSAIAGRVDFRQLTAARAEQTQRALETYYAREGHYPDTLQALVPRDAVVVAGPVILYGQDWCYVGGGDSYRLGYLDREHWSSPILFGRVVAAKGQAAPHAEVCQSALSAYRALHPEWDAMVRLYGKPTPTPATVE